MMKEIYGFLSVAVYVATIILYIHSAVRGSTRPHAFSWGIWALTGLIVFWAQHVEGAGPGAWLQGGLAFSCLAVMIVALTKYGDRSYAVQDWIALGTALSAIPLWMATGTPLWSVLLICAIDTVGIIPTVRKSWRKPDEEPALLYVSWSVSALLSLLAVQDYSVSTTASSVCIIIFDMFLAILLPLRRRAMAGEAA